MECDCWSMSAHGFRDLVHREMDLSGERDGQRTTSEHVEDCSHCDWNDLGNDQDQRLLSVDYQENADSGIDTECQHFMQL